eukprot:gene27627-34093_t
MRASAEERRQKLKVEDKVAAVVMTDDEVWNAELQEEVFVLPEVYDRLRDQKLYHEKRAAVKYCMYGKQLHEKNVTVVLDASRAVDIKEWLLQYDNRFT